MDNYYHKRRNGNVFIGILLAAAGILFLLRQFNVIHFGFQIWPLFLILIGIMSGVKHQFRKPGAYILIAIGLANIVPEFMIFGQPSTNLFWPLMLIGGGLFIALRPKKRFADLSSKAWQKTSGFEANIDDATISNTDYLNIDATFGGRKEIITSKQFKGVNASTICGGLEINLMQADSTTQPMVLDLKVLFGGVEIIIPSHWEVINEVEVMFGAFEDKRVLRTVSDAAHPKTLLLRGSVTFGGIEIKSY
jgi:predicted membrane protein